MNYRLHIDIALGTDLEEAKELADHIVGHIARMEIIEGLSNFKYKLCNDGDRGNKNYLDINENGHCSNQKIQRDFGDE